MNLNFINKVTRTLRRILLPSKKIPEYSERKVTQLPPEGESISVETALNSRCNSDHESVQSGLHWGMFSRDEKLSEAQIQKIVDSSTIPRFTDYEIKIKIEQNWLTFITINNVSGIDHDWLMIESGMQQQAVGLACAALGVGMVFKNLGVDGQHLSEQEYGTTQYRLDPMKPGYNGKYWTDLPPRKWKPWMQGNLSDPSRHGSKSLISALRECKTQKRNDTRADSTHVSQLLWAARGRTPHFYKSKPWGMTIPFWLDKNELTRVFLLQENQVFNYVNWSMDRPTNHINKITTINSTDSEIIGKFFGPFQTYILLCQNEDYARSFWEIGYQLMNLLVQADALGISYKASLIKPDEIGIFENIGLTRPSAIFMV